jgi:hypothetical protein
LGVRVPLDPDDDELGPIGFRAIEFPAPASPRRALNGCSLADRGVNSILDLEFIAKDSADNAGKIDVREVGTSDVVDLSAWQARR